jgi:hypothetical protein
MDELTPPNAYFIGGGHTKLYKLEEQRTKAIKACAREWATIAGIGEENYWTTSIPQALFDSLDNWDTGCAAIAAETLLKKLGWKVERPVRKI